jgi:hypothetical protein
MYAFDAALALVQADVSEYGRTLAIFAAVWVGYALLGKWIKASLRAS